MLLRIRAEIDELHQKWFIEATELGMTVGTTPPEPRTVERQTYRANTPSGFPEEYYRRVLSLPFLDNITNQINGDFSHLSILSLYLSSLLPVIDKLCFPNIYTALQIAATIPVTTCSCE